MILSISWSESKQLKAPEKAEEAAIQIIKGNSMELLPLLINPDLIILLNDKPA
jgi:hypothetical protein